MKEEEKGMLSPYFQKVEKTKPQEIPKIHSAIVFELTRQQFYERMSTALLVVLHLKQRNPKDVINGFKLAIACLFESEPMLKDALLKDADDFFQIILKKHYENLK